MKNRLSGKWVLITGATSGIGLSSARLFAGSECNLILTGRREERLENIQNELSAENNIEILTASFDIQNRQACLDFTDQLAVPVDILINNAGLASGVDAVFDADFEDWDAMIDTNIKGLITMTRLITPRMKERNQGHIINVGSIAGHESYQGGSVYCATKHAVKAFTEATKKDLYDTDIRVSMVSPGLVETEFSVVRYKGDKESADEVYEGIKPLNGDDIAEIIHFMANRPSHVNIMDTIVFPVRQSSSSLVYRGE